MCINLNYWCVALGCSLKLSLILTFSCFEGSNCRIFFSGAHIFSKVLIIVHHFVTISTANRTRLLNISTYSSMTLTKDTKELKNWQLSLEHGLKHKGEFENHWPPGLHKQVNHTIFLFHKKLKTKGLCYRPSSKF